MVVPARTLRLLSLLVPWCLIAAACFGSSNPPRPELSANEGVEIDTGDPDTAAVQFFNGAIEVHLSPASAEAVVGQPGFIVSLRVVGANAAATDAVALEFVQWSHGGGLAIPVASRYSAAAAAADPSAGDEAIDPHRAQANFDCKEAGETTYSVRFELYPSDLYRILDGPSQGPYDDALGVTLSDQDLAADPFQATITRPATCLDDGGDAGSDTSSSGDDGDLVSLTDAAGDWFESGRSAWDEVTGEVVQTPPAVDEGVVHTDLLGVEQVSDSRWEVQLGGDIEQAAALQEIFSGSISLIFLLPDGNRVEMIWGFRGDGPPEQQVSASNDDLKKSVKGLTMRAEGDKLIIEFTGLDLPSGTTVHAVSIGSHRAGESVYDVTNQWIFG